MSAQMTGNQFGARDRINSPGTVLKWLPTIMLGLLTLGFLMYQLGVALGSFSAFLGGYVVGMTVALFPISLIAYLARIISTHRGMNSVEILFFVFSGMILAIAALNSSAGAYAAIIAETHYFVVIQFITLFCIVRDVSLESERARKILIGLTFAATGVVLLLNANSSEAIGTDPLAEVADYQQIGTYYFILLLFGAAMIRSPVWRGSLYAVGLAVLFFNGARSELFAWVIVMTVVEAFRSRRMAALIALGLILLVPAISVIVNLLITYFPDNRVAMLFLNTTQDQSFVDRSYTLNQALHTISTNPIFGDYARYEPGRYAHNALSVWQDFGLLPFLIFVFTLLFALKRVVVMFRRNRRSDRKILLFAAAAFVAVFQFGVSKAFASPLFPIVMALYARSLTNERMRESMHFSLPMRQGSMGRHPGNRQPTGRS